MQKSKNLVEVDSFRKLSAPSTGPRVIRLFYGARLRSFSRQWNHYHRSSGPHDYSKYNGIIWLCKTKHHLSHVQDQIFSPHWEEIKFQPLLRLLPQWRVTIKKKYFWYLFEWILLNNEGKLKLSVKCDRSFKTNESTKTSFHLQSVLLPLMAVISGIQINSNKMFSWCTDNHTLYNPGCFLIGIKSGFVGWI